jgi:L-asparaginase
MRLDGSPSPIRRVHSLSGAIGHYTKGKPVLRTTPGPRCSSGDAADTQVALVKAYPGMSGAGIEAIVAEGSRGLVIEGFGVMNVPDSIIATIEKCIDQGVAVVVASRSVTTGGLDQGPPRHRLLHELGAIGSYGLAANKAWVALMVGLASTDGSAEELRRWFLSIGN